MRGAHIVIEGPDAVGKATQSARLRDHFLNTGADARVFSFPRYETELGRFIKAHLRREVRLAPSNFRDGAGHDPQVEMWDALMFQCLSSADKFEGAVEIDNYVQGGGIAICDRWWQSTFAYGTADGLDGEWLKRLPHFLPCADLNILINVPLDESRRRKLVPDDRYEADRQKQLDVRRIYSELWCSAPMFGPGYTAADAVALGGGGEWKASWRYLVVDGIGTVDEVHERIRVAAQPLVSEIVRG